MLLPVMPAQAGIQGFPLFLRRLKTYPCERAKEGEGTKKIPSHLLHQVLKRCQGSFGTFSGSNDNLFVVAISRITSGKDPSYPGLSVTVYFNLSSLVGL